ncbi:MAG TPA: porin family protein, partial [Flavobacteriaceae bacterium]|nr:porin family protein [Flavobacteriaceae bacterium]
NILTLVAVLGFLSISAQTTKFGVTAGFTNITERAKSDEISYSQSEAGFYIGALADFTVSEKFHIQPQALYANAAESSFLYIPVLAKYYAAEKLFLLAGPQANIFLEETPEEINSVGIDLTFGLGYEINENFFIEARYSFEMTNRYTGDFDITDRLNTLHVGVGYKF